MSVRILTDSASDLLQADFPGLTVLPMTVTFGRQEYLDGVTLTHQHFYELLIEGDELPVTSQINPARFAEAFGEAVAAGDEVVAVTLSSKLSGTWQSAVVAAEDFEGKVFVVDSENAAIGQGILVQRALELAQSGMSAAAIARQLDEEKKSIRLIALLDTLEYLKRGGRLSASAAAVGGILNIKPVVAVVDGEVVMLGKARGSKNGNNLLVQEIEKTSGIDFGRPCCLGWTGLSDELLQKYIEDSASLWKGHIDTLPIRSVGATIGTHVGPGVVAVAFYAKGDE